MNAPGERVAVVTHATRYAGPASVTALAGAGFRVVCHDERFEDTALRAEFEAAHEGTVACAEGGPAGAVTRTLERYGRLDVVIGNDVYRSSPLMAEDVDAIELRQTAAALLVTPVTAVGRAAAYMKRQGRGHIVLITSAAPVGPEQGFSYYSSVRAAATVFARAAARELAPHGVTVNAIAPHFLADETYHPQWGTGEGRTRLPELLPVGRLGHAKELGELVVLLSSGTQDALTGEVVGLAGSWARAS